MLRAAKGANGKTRKTKQNSVGYLVQVTHLLFKICVVIIVLCLMSHHSSSLCASRDRTVFQDGFNVALADTLEMYANASPLVKVYYKF